MLENEVPHVKSAVHLGGEKDARPDWRPLSVGQVGHVVLGPHDRVVLDLLGPDARRPVAHREEVLGKEGIALQAVDGSVVARINVGDLLGVRLAASIAVDDLALLGAHHELGRHGRLVLERHGAQRVLDVALLLRIEHNRLDRVLQASVVPPEHLAVRTRREELRAGLGLHPDGAVCRIAVTLLDQ